MCPSPLDEVNKVATRSKEKRSSAIDPRDRTTEEILPPQERRCDRTTRDLSSTGAVARLDAKRSFLYENRCSIGRREILPRQEPWRDRTKRETSCLLDSSGYRGEVWLSGRALSGALEADRGSLVSGFCSPLAGAWFESARPNHTRWTGPRPSGYLCVSVGGPVCK